MSVGRLFTRNPVWVALTAKITFVAVASIRLRVWGRLEEASCWAEQRWQVHGRKYRRTVDAAKQVAHFEFEHNEETIEFLMRFG